jgi:hypothetical protein
MGKMPWFHRRCPSAAGIVSMRTLLAVAVLAALARTASAGLIVNGDFQSGNTGFITNYNFSPGNIGPQQTYDVLSNPFPAHPSAASYFDHTFNTAAGKMLAVNEANAAGVLVWGQTVAVAANSDYTFTAYISSWVGAAPTQLDVLFNGASIGVMQAPSSTGTWVQFTVNWNSGAATSAAIELRNVIGADIGGDFALDDLSLDGPDPSAVPEPNCFALALFGLGLVSARVWSKGRGVREVLDSTRVYLD